MFLHSRRTPGSGAQVFHESSPEDAGSWNELGGFGINKLAVCYSLRAGMMASRLNHRERVIPALTDHLEDKGGVVGAKSSIAISGSVNCHCRISAIGCLQRLTGAATAPGAWRYSPQSFALIARKHLRRIVDLTQIDMGKNHEEFPSINQHLAPRARTAESTPIRFCTSSGTR